ncbi:MAG: glycosyltransferase [Chloroflexota bacterium]
MFFASLLFWVSACLLVWVYVVYPALTLLYGRLRPVRIVERAQWPALVTVGLAAHDGGAQIAERLTDICAQVVPFEIEMIVASDGSDDDTADVVMRASVDDHRVRLIDLPRSGQSAAQGAIFGAARGDIVVLTDLETRFAPGCLAALIEPLRDPAVGCSTGVLRWRYDEATPTARHEGLYWRYEQAVRRWESRAGWLTAATGALLAVRSSLYRPAPAHASLDQMLPLIARDEGLLVVVANSASGTDRGTAGMRDQFLSRMRIATQGIESNVRMALRITPWRRPGSFLAIWSHKVLRWATPFFVGVGAISSAYLALTTGNLWYWLPAAVVGLVAGLSLIGYLARRLGRSMPLASFALTVTVVTGAFALAWINVALRRRVGAWATVPLPERDDSFA